MVTVSGWVKSWFPKTRKPSKQAKQQILTCQFVHCSREFDRWENLDRHLREDHQRDDPTPAVPRTVEATLNAFLRSKPSAQSSGKGREAERVSEAEKSSHGFPKTKESNKTISCDTISEAVKTTRAETADSTTEASPEPGIGISVSNEGKLTEGNPQSYFLYDDDDDYWPAC